MADIVYLEEFRIKRDLSKATNALCTARSLRADGIEVPNDVFGRLQQIINNLEDKLADVEW